MVDLSLATLYQHPSFFVQNIWNLNYLPSHLLSSIVRFDFIFRMDLLLSLKHQLTIKLMLQRWWKLELIHSQQIKLWDQFPVLPFPFYDCRVKQQEILQEKMVILILKDCWRIMREILKDWKVWNDDILYFMMVGWIKISFHLISSFQKILWYDFEMDDNWSDLWFH